MRSNLSFINVYKKANIKSEIVTQLLYGDAFKRLKNDPQDLNLLGSKTTRLTESYRGRRLGHNWSISWVADKLGPLN